MRQIHSDTVHIVTDKDDFFNPPICDALITNKTDVPLMVMMADCTGVVFTCKEAVAVAHVGRQGAFLDIVSKVVATMRERFDAKKIDVTTSAAICDKCYEVDENIARQAQKLGYGFALQQIEKRIHLDIRAIITHQLHKNGIGGGAVSLTCNACENERYFSYRKEGTTGRFAAVAMLR